MGTTIIASVAQGRGKSAEYRKVLVNNTDIFSTSSKLTTSNEYNPGTILEDDEWFSISEFSTKPYCLPLLKQTTVFSSVDYISINGDDFGNIKFLCAFQDDKFFFQRVTPSLQVKRKKTLWFGDICEYKEASDFITVNDFADAIFIKLEDKLYFRKLSAITSIFNRIDELYREANKDEVDNFLGRNFIELKDGFASDNVNKNNRKLIAMALETLGRFSNEEKDKVFGYIKEYYPELASESGKFVVNNEKSLQSLLYGIEQRYYTTPIGDERRLANSVQKL
ncbi:hypothetical protein AGMMS49975_18460 [Clostridia bacterium]|nr:hypothetical protein AGMMS49975_18460 [Clostridia bacterium]